MVGFRPLARRVGAHADLWFIGWGLMAVNMICHMFQTPDRLLVLLVSRWALSGAGLLFVYVAANFPKPRISGWMMTAMSLPVLLMPAIDTYSVRRPEILVASCVFLLAPGVLLLARKRERNSSVILVCAAYAAVGIITTPVVLQSVYMAALVDVALIFLSAAYFYWTGAPRHSRGVIAATIGFACWGLRFPLVAIFLHYFPTVRLEGTILDLPIYFVVIGTSLTLLEEHMERTERMAMHDPLTGLPNRRLFEERLIATMEEARISRTTIACLVIDVDNFKQINDTLGHSAGDQLLRALAVRLSWHMTPRDILARTGGDEFTALLAGVHDEHHLRFIAGAMMSAGSVPIIIDGKPVDLHISIGIALSPDHADDIDSLRRAADQAMYTAKRRGGSMLAFAEED